MSIENNEVARGWRENSMFSGETRGFDFYAKRLRLVESDLLGKKILDLGSGAQGAFASDLIHKGFKRGDVISLSPHFSESANREKLRSSREGSTGVAAVAQHLPFRDQSFDYVLAVWSVPFHIRIREYQEVPEEAENQVRGVLRESIRILKPGGQLRIFPFKEEDTKSLEFVLAEMGQRAVTFTIIDNRLLLLEKKTL